MTSRRQLVLGLVFWGSAIVMLVLALLPTNQALPSTGWDKSNHALGFFVFALLGQLTYPATTWRVLIGVILYGGGIEIAQSFTGYRSAEWLDWLADALGAGFAVLLLTGWHRWRRH